MPEHPCQYRGHRFPREVIAHAVRLYVCFALGLRDVEELLAGRCVQVSYGTVHRWAEHYGAHYAQELRKREAPRGRTWHLGELAVRIGGRRHWLWRAVDEHGRTLNVLLQAHRDIAAADRFFRHLLALAGGTLRDRITTDELGSYAAALTGMLEMHAVEHVQVRSAMRCTSRVEQAHQPTRVRERLMHRFRTSASAQRVADAVTRVANRFRPRPHLLERGRVPRGHAPPRHRATASREIAGLRAA